MADSKRTQPSRAPAAPAARPSPAETSSLVFVHHGSQASRTQPALTTAARAHASRRGHSKSAAAVARRPIRFVSVQGAGEHGGTAAGGSAPAATLTPSYEPAMVSARHPHQQHYDGHHDQWQQHQHQHNLVATGGSSRAVVVPLPGETGPPRSLRADSWDPFDSLAVRSLSHTEQFMLHYALTTTWTKFGESRTGQQELVQSWIWTTIESPAALFAQIAGASAHYLTVPHISSRQQRRAFTTSLQAKQKSFKALRREIDRFHEQQQELADPWSRHDSIANHHASPEVVVTPTSANSSSPSPPASESTSSASSSPSYMSSSAPVEPVSAQSAVAAYGAAGATDGMVLAILVLAVHDSIDLTSVPEPHPLAPLSMYRDMHIYGRMTIRDEHMTALYSLIDQKGGLPRMNQSIFGYVLPPADMLYNLRRGLPPRVPCHRQLAPMRDSNKWIPDPRAEYLLGVSGSAFREVECLHVIYRAAVSAAPCATMPPVQSTTTTSQPVSVGLEGEVLRLLGLMAELTVAFDHYIRGDRDAGSPQEYGVAQAVSGGKAPRSLDFFVNNADLVAHRLTCLGSLLPEHQDAMQSVATKTSTTVTNPGLGRSAGDGPPHGGGDQSGDGTTSRTGGSHVREVRRYRHPRYLVLREVSRRAALVYQDMVIFPTPARTGFKLRHARAMLPLLRALLGSAGQKRHQHDYDMGAWSWEEDQLEVEVVYDDDDGGDGEQATDNCSGSESRGGALNGGSGGDVAHVPLRSPQPSSSSSSSPRASPAQGDMTTTTSYNRHQHNHAGPRQSEVDFLSWATMLGAIATRFTPLQGAYVAQLALDVSRQSTDRLATGTSYHHQQQQHSHDESETVAAWQEQKNRMMRFLWLDSVCDEPGRIVWEQALAVVRQREWT